MRLKDIKDVDDFNGEASDLFERFLMTFTKENGLIRDVNENDPYSEDEVSFMYTWRGQRLAERMRDRLYKVGRECFPDEEDEIEIETSYYQEF